MYLEHYDSSCTDLNKISGDGHVVEDNNLAVDGTRHRQCATSDEGNSPDGAGQEGEPTSTHAAEGCSHRFSDLDYLLKGEIFQYSNEAI